MLGLRLAFWGRFAHTFGVSQSSSHFRGPPSGAGSTRRGHSPVDSQHALRIGPYVTLRELGRGSFGVVYLARDAEGQQLALKVMLPGGHDEDVQRFVREGELTARFDHPGIVRVLGRGTHRGLPWLALEFCAGSNLRERLLSGPFPIPHALQLILQLCDALKVAHAAGVIHRDLKPANVLLDLQGRPRIADFGLARGERGAGLTRSGDGLGSPMYMPPEQFSGAKHVDVRADVYALGLLLYECLCATQPFEGLTVMELTQAIHSGTTVPLRQRRADVPPWLASVCERAFACDPEERYPSVEAFRAALVAGDTPQHGAVASRRAQPPTPARRSRGGKRSVLPIVLLAGAAGFALTSGLVLAVSWRGGGAKGQAELAAAQGFVRAGELSQAQLAYAAASEAGVSDEATQDAIRLLEQLEAAEADLEAGKATYDARELVDHDPRHSPLAPWFPARRDRLQLQVRASDLGLDPSAQSAQSVVDALVAGVGLEATRERLAHQLLEFAVRRSGALAKLAEVVELLELAERVAPGPELRAEIALEAARVHFRRGDFVGALERAQALVDTPGQTGLRARYTAAYSKLWTEGRGKEALEDMHALWQRDLKGAVGLTAGAVWHGYTSKTKRALELVTEALTLDPENLQAQITFAFCSSDRFLQTGEQALIDQSLAASSRVIARRPDEPRAYMARGQGQGALRQAEQSARSYGRVVELTALGPHLAAVKRRLKLLLGLRRHAEALVCFNTLIDGSASPAPEDLFFRGVVHHQLGHVREAADDWRGAKQTSPEGFQRLFDGVKPTLQRAISEALERR